MQFAFSDEQIMIRETARSYAGAHGASERIRRAIDEPDGFDRAAWHALTAELGFAGIAIPEAYGGAGLGMVELASVQEMLGGTLMPTPYLASAGLAAALILAAGSDAQKAALLPPIASGACIATLAWCDDRGGADPAHVAMRIDAEGRLHGEACFVPFAHVADLILCAARGPDDAIAVVAVRGDAAGLSVERLTMMDLTRPMARVRCDGVAVAPEALFPGAGAALVHVMRVGALLVAAEAVGGAEAALEATVAYSRQREQFGRPIGSFQALKHRMADMMMAMEAARGLAWYAAASADEAPAQLGEAASVAKVACTEAMMKCAADMIQLHGGIGFTWEHDAHLFFKRARGALTLFGTPEWHRETIMTEIERGAAA